MRAWSGPPRWGTSSQEKLRFLSPLRGLHFCLCQEGVRVELSHQEVSDECHFPPLAMVEAGQRTGLGLPLRSWGGGGDGLV